MSSSTEQENRTVLYSELPGDWTTADFQEIFCHVGPIQSLKSQQRTGDTTSVLVTYTCSADAGKSIREFQGANIGGKACRAEFALMRKSEDGGGIVLNGGGGRERSVRRGRSRSRSRSRGREREDRHERDRRERSRSRSQPRRMVPDRRGWGEPDTPSRATRARSRSLPRDPPRGRSPPRSRSRSRSRSRARSATRDAPSAVPMTRGGSHRPSNQPPVTTNTYAPYRPASFRGRGKGSFRKGGKGFRSTSIPRRSHSQQRPESNTDNYKGRKGYKKGPHKGTSTRGRKVFDRSQFSHKQGAGKDPRLHRVVVQE